ncbi:rCG51693 [Rattus norvegicus]|uniref:RCG51693 n=1 Tax=Rattus norvegicus TaxID=10116 RepID=A6IYX1_RAT|nr:rCG51693 [Rattus norvegicus]
MHRGTLWCNYILGIVCLEGRMLGSHLHQVIIGCGWRKHFGHVLFFQDKRLKKYICICPC